MYEIFGVPVLGSVHYKWTNEKFSIPGMGDECSLDLIYHLATSKPNGEYARYYPERVAAAKEIYNHIMREIGGKTMSTRKPINAKHQTFAEYLTDLEAVYTDVLAQRNELYQKYSAVKQEYENSRKNPKYSEADRVIAHADWLKAKEAYEQAADELDNHRDAEIGAIRKSLQEHIDTFYAANPEDIDANTIRLLESGILTGSEYERLARANRDNITMLRVIGNHATKKLAALREAGETISSNSDYAPLVALENNILSSTTGNKEFEVFDTLATVAHAATRESAAQSPTLWAGAWEEAYSNATSRAADLPTQPTADE